MGTHSGRASVQSVWVTRRWRVVKAFPRQRVGTRNQSIILKWAKVFMKSLF
ncbi:hypothetical protein QUF54_01980 [Candidatus Marithioploca araucensis]|uniref:Uncharacterized protein n=1 Tax=Candidatus Marithioploca araucensis TaxID=70273 RepID=A0ABT7VR17_9GAMM|nr:hypothetical protein [Candidatus Marithioploca araucensis]